LFLRAGASPVGIAPLQGGMRAAIDLRSISQRDSFYQGHYDGPLIAACVRLLQEHCVVLDVGANVGMTLLPLAASVRALGGTMHAFEPVQKNLEVLRANVARNDLSALVHVWPFGLSATCGTAEIVLREDFVGGAESGNAAIKIDVSDDRFMKETIQLRSLDDFRVHTSPLSRLDLVKLDIEGHEDFFLEGAQDTLRQLRPIIVMEVNKVYYARRGVSLDDRLHQLVPDYQMLVSERAEYRNWRKSESTNACTRLDNVFLVPRERVDAVLARLSRH
jgi:FkbM family methyltransferase